MKNLVSSIVFLNEWEAVKTKGKAGACSLKGAICYLTHVLFNVHSQTYPLPPSCPAWTWM